MLRAAWVASSDLSVMSWASRWVAKCGKSGWFSNFLLSLEALCLHWRCLAVFTGVSVLEQSCLVLWQEEGCAATFVQAKFVEIAAIRTTSPRTKILAIVGNHCLALTKTLRCTKFARMSFPWILIKTPPFWGWLKGARLGNCKLSVSFLAHPRNLETVPTKNS